MQERSKEKLMDRPSPKADPDPTAQMLATAQAELRQRIRNMEAAHCAPGSGY
jgi:hypothetical protein